LRIPWETGIQDAYNLGWKLAHVLFGAADTLLDTYRGSRLSCGLDDTTGIRAGDRAPDAPCVFATSGEKVRLLDLFRGTHFTLLILGDQPVPLLLDVSPGSLHVYTVMHEGSVTAISDHTLVESDGHASHAYGITGDALILVRPDGYIGLTGGRADFQPIMDYLRNVTGQ
jgi:FAD binding domain